MNIEQTEPDAMMNPSRMRIMILHQDMQFARNLISVLDSSVSYQVASCVKSPIQAFECYRQDRPHLVACGIHFSGMSGLEFTKSLMAEFPKAKVLVISACDESVYALRSLRAGARGYLCKDAQAREILEAIKTVLEDRCYVTPRFAQRILAKMVHTKEFVGESPVGHLTDRELEILTWISQGHTSRQIAEALYLSVKTVETHRTHIKVKMGFSTSFELKMFAKAWKDEGML